MTDHRVSIRSLLRISVLGLAAFGATGCGKLAARMEFQQGNRAYADGEYSRAIDHYQKGLDRDPSVQKVWRSVGLAHMALIRPEDSPEDQGKRADLAIKAFKEYLKYDPVDKKISDYLLTTRISSKRYDEALTQLNEEARANPSDARVPEAISRVLIEAGRLQEAYDAATKPGVKPAASIFSTIAVQIWRKVYVDPKKPQVNLMSTEERTRWVELGLQAIDRAAKIDSKDLSTLAYYGLLLREKAKLEPDPEKVLEIQLEAQKWTEKAVALSKAAAPPADAAASKPAN
jgi:tetratricopeptide (TPR) repeat protein